MSEEAGSRQERRRSMMLLEPMHKVIPKMAVPTVISMLVSAFYNLVDTYFVSYLGTAATGAVGVNSSLENFIMMAGSFLAIGANSYIARLLGAKQEKKASQVLSTSFFSALITGTLVMICGFLWMRPLVNLLGAHGEVEQYAVDYAGYVLYAAPLMAASFVMNQCLRSEGSASFSMIGMVAGSLLNIGLDPLFIFVFGWGIKGASAATAISKAVSFVILLWPYLHRHSMLHLSPKNICFSKDICTEVFKMGSPSLLRNGLSTIAGILLNNIAGAYSAAALAAISVTNRIIMFLTFAVLGFGQGFQPVAGFNWGAKRYDRVRQAYRFSAIVGVAAITVISLLVALFSKQLIGLFTDTDAEMMRIGALSIALQCAAMPIHAWVIVVNMLYAGTGKAFGAITLGITRQGICFFPLVWLLPHLFGVNGIAAIQAVADGLSLFVALPFAVSIQQELKRLDRQQGEAPPESANTEKGT
ncbi:MAG: MATE family efflux transporter [Clostridiaceae bacterium]|nr:MATE family efflux transporter [Clostridiaceae bacterium]